MFCFVLGFTTYNIMLSMNKDNFISSFGIFVTFAFSCFLLPGSSVGEESACNAGDPGSIPGSGRSAGGGTGHPLQYSWASLAQLVKNPLQCVRPGFDPWVGKVPWRRESLPTPVLWPGELHGLYSPWGRREWDRLSGSPFTLPH